MTDQIEEEWKTTRKVILYRSGCLVLRDWLCPHFLINFINYSFHILDFLKPGLCCSYLRSHPDGQVNSLHKTDPMSPTAQGPNWNRKSRTVGDCISEIRLWPMPYEVTNICIPVRKCLSFLYSKFHRHRTVPETKKTTEECDPQTTGSLSFPSGFLTDDKEFNSRK